MKELKNRCIGFIYGTVAMYVLEVQPLLIAPSTSEQLVALTLIVA